MNTKRFNSNLHNKVPIYTTDDLYHYFINIRTNLSHSFLRKIVSEK